MNAARFADLLHHFFQLDTWYTQEGAERTVRSKRKPHQATLTAAGLIESARRAGWLEEDAHGGFCIASRCWLPLKQAQRAA